MVQVVFLQLKEDMQATRVCLRAWLIKVFFSNEMIRKSCSIFGIVSFLLACQILSPVVLLSKEDVALSRANTIWHMDTSIGLTYEELLKTCRYIESLHASEGKKSKTYSREHTKLPCTIVHVPSLHGFLIVNLQGNMIVGHGAHKSVEKAILYAASPKIVANCVSDASGKDEITILRTLKGSPGIIPFLGSASLPDKKYSIYLEYFPGGSLRSFMKNGCRFSDDEVLKVFEDLVAGLRSLHDHQLVHRDLHSGNIVLRKIPGGTYEAALLDFGKTRSAMHLGDDVAPQVPRSRNPPEALQERYSQIDRFLADVYGLGCNFYECTWGEELPWAYTYDIYAMPIYSSAQKKVFFETIVQKYEATKRRRIGVLLEKVKTGGALTKHERLQIVIFQMIDVDPKHRPSCQQIQKLLF